MRSQKFILSGVAALGIVMLPAAALVSSPAGSAAPGRPSAVATFASQTGCITTEVSIFVRQGGDRRERLGLRILMVDECKEIALVNIDAKASLPVGSLRVAPDLSYATLNTSVRVADRQSHGKVTATLHLTWKAAEKAVTGLRSDEPEDLGKFIRMKEPVRRTLRLANASGTVSIAGTSIALSPAESAWIANAAGGVPKEP